MAESRQSDDVMLETTVDIVSAYLGHNAVEPAVIPDLIAAVHRALTGVEATQEPPANAPTPAVSIRKSITPDFMISLEDGRKYKSLKRHLRIAHGLSPEEYRRKWGLPDDYPMVAPNYSVARSAMARAIGLGQGGRKPAKAEAAAKSKPAVRKAARAKA
ncbi:MucR family transcriptional regulator (plasmid) [Brevundimonas staleyi]|uniref:MucR family transcriptional regulator n=1 Tax=Brevundimonas staleyi TaxID=74326 RepID=A0ABW0FNT2_9CAUL